MLSVYTRHYPPCANKNPAYRRCKCPKWIQGTTDTGEFIRRSAKTRSWKKAQDLVNAIENPKKTPPAEPPEPVQPEPDPKRTKIEDAVETFLDDANSRGLQKSTQDKLIHLCRHQLLDWAKSQPLIYLDELTTANLTVFRNGWSDAALSKKKKHERLIGFFSFCVGCDWIHKNPASAMGRVKSNPVPTDYFPRDEFDRIIDSTYIYQEKGYVERRNHATRLRTMALLMRWSGLRISDAVTLERYRLTDNKLLLYQAKTGTPVFGVFSASLRARVVVADLLRDYAKWRTGEDRRLTSSSGKFWESRCRRPQSPVPALIIDENPVGRGAIGEPNGIFRD